MACRLGVQGNGQQALPTTSVPPLSLDEWYNVTMSVNGQQLLWGLGDTKGCVALTPSHETNITHGQLAIGLVNYGYASIDNLVVDGVERL